MNRRRWFELALLLLLAFIFVSERPKRHVSASTAGFEIHRSPAITEANLSRRSATGGDQPAGGADAAASALPADRAARPEGPQASSVVCKWVTNAFRTGLFVGGAGPHCVYVGAAFYDLTLKEKGGALAALAACDGDDILLAYDLQTGKKVAEYSKRFGLRMQ